MSRAGILLRIVLVLSLVLNGIGGSLAATAMALESAASASAPHDLATAAHSGCHHHPSMSHHQKPSPAGEQAGRRPGGRSDCCGMGLCGCACTQLSSLAASELLFDPPRLEHERHSDAVDPTRPAPVLPHLIRPPIA